MESCLRLCRVYLELNACWLISIIHCDTGCVRTSTYRVGVARAVADSVVRRCTGVYVLIREFDFADNEFY